MVDRKRPVILPACIRGPEEHGEVLVTSNPYDRKYQKPEFYWGTKPSALCDRLLRHLGQRSPRDLCLLDLGCGEGRNAVYFASHGFSVTALDSSPSGLEKTRRLASEQKTEITLIEADIIDWRPERDSFDVILSTGTLHYLPPDLRYPVFQSYRSATRAGGINAMNVFVEKPFVAPPPDAEGMLMFRSGELFGYYWDWEIVDCCENIFDCMSGGIPHRHALNRMIARKV